MKDEILNEFYDELNKELNNKNYVNSLKELIDSSELDEDSLEELILKEVF